MIILKDMEIRISVKNYVADKSFMFVFDYVLLLT
jgi:hypothetical protein